MRISDWSSDVCSSDLPRLAALTWGAKDLAAAIGATGNKEEGGRWTDPYRLARSLCLYASASAGVAPVDTLYADFRNPEGLEADRRRARRDAFTGRTALHPDQVALLTRCSNPYDVEIAEAQKIAPAFAALPTPATHDRNNGVQGERGS